MRAVKVRRAGLMGKVFLSGLTEGQAGWQGTNLCHFVAVTFMKMFLLLVMCLALLLATAVLAVTIFSFLWYVVVQQQSMTATSAVGFLLGFVSTIVLVIVGTVKLVRAFLRTEVGQVIRAWCAAKKAKVCPRVEFW